MVGVKALDALARWVLCGKLPACMVHLMTSEGTRITHWSNPPALPARKELTGLATSPGNRLGSRNFVATLSPVKMRLLIKPECNEKGAGG